MPLAVVGLATEAIDLAVLLIVAHDFDPMIDLGFDRFADLVGLRKFARVDSYPAHIDGRPHRLDGYGEGIGGVRQSTRWIDHGRGRYLVRGSSGLSRSVGLDDSASTTRTSTASTVSARPGKPDRFARSNPKGLFGSVG